MILSPLPAFPHLRSPINFHQSHEISTILFRPEPNCDPLQLLGIPKTFTGTSQAPSTLVSTFLHPSPTLLSTPTEIPLCPPSSSPFNSTPQLSASGFVTFNSKFLEGFSAKYFFPVDPGSLYAAHGRDNPVNSLPDPSTVASCSCKVVFHLVLVRWGYLPYCAFSHGNCLISCLLPMPVACLPALLIVWSFLAASLLAQEG